MFLLVMLDVYLWGFLLVGTELSIKLSGLLLQVVGMVFAIKGVIAARNYLKEDSICDLVKEWLKKAPKWRRAGSIYNTSINLSTSAATAFGTGSVWSGDDEEADTSTRIKNIVNNMANMRVDVARTKEQIYWLKIQHKAQLEKIDAAEKSATEKIKKDLDQLHAKDWAASLIGLVWILIGIVLSTIPDLIVKLVPAVS